ncbi:MAG: TIGR01777 family oxidoreductase [Omnitrophica WOR_2 bacterium]
MRVIITGGTGFLGRSLGTDLVKEGHEVIVLSRSPVNYQERLPAGMRTAQWDGKSAQGWGHLADGAGAIINMAGDNLSSGRWTREKKKRILNSRINAGKAVVEAVEMAKTKPGVIVQSSAVGIYGPQGDDEVTEANSLGTDFLAEICKAWEASTARVEEMGVRRVITRTGLPLSKTGGVLPLMSLPYRLFVGGPVGDGRQYVPWIHIADETGAIRFLMNNPEASGPYNLSAPHPLTNRQFGKALAQVLRRPAIFPVPAILIKLLFGEMSIIILKGQREIPRRLLESGYRFRFSEAESALRDLYRKK